MALNPVRILAKYTEDFGATFRFYWVVLKRRSLPPIRPSFSMY